MCLEARQQGEAKDAEPRRKPEGGFAFFTVTQLVMAWTALREAEINLKELRVYFALAEMKSRRCGCTDDDPPPEFTPLEIRRLVGGAGGEREAVNKLVAVGLLREVSKTNIEFATDPGDLRFEPETLEATLDLIPNNDRRVPVPRRIVRLIAGGARRTLIATILGHLIRCLFYKRGMCHPKGCVKASWIAEVFGVSERRVHEQRRHLVALGWLLPQETSQRTLNGHGLWVTINLAWDALAEAKERLYEPVVEQAGVAAAVGAPEPASPAAESPAKLSLPPGDTRHGGRRRGLDPQQRAQARGRAASSLPAPVLLRHPLVPGRAGHGAGGRGRRHLAALARDHRRRGRLRARRCRGAARVWQPLAERPRGSLAARRTVRSDRASRR